MEITPIQKGVFKAIDNKKHLVGLAPTGTGKNTCGTYFLF